MALVSTVAVLTENSSSGADGSSQGVLVAMAFEPVTYTVAGW